jgi:CelD/BcsL family acetyltransferase involved in cellulose biosynthesis
MRASPDLELEFPGPRHPHGADTVGLRLNETSMHREGRSTGKRQYECAVLTTFAALEGLQEEWYRLFHECESTNGFAHPAWLTAWAKRYVEDGQICVLTVRAGDDLVAVAPFHRTALLPRFPVASGRRGRVLRLLGNGRASELTELPEILIRNSSRHDLLRIVMRGILDLVEDWDWLELTLTPEQGWFDPEWIAPIDIRPRAFPIHKGTRACVVSPLAATWESQRSSLGRNVRESIRRGENRLRRAGHDWQFVDRFPDSRAVEAAVDQIIRLHRGRPDFKRGPHHESCLEDDHACTFLREAVAALVAAGHASPVELVVDEEVVAARLLLHAARSTYFSLGGFDAAWWDFGVATTLMAESIRAAILRGDTSLNLSTGPDRSKLRWSRQLRLHEDFYVVRTERRSRLAFAAFWMARASILLHRQRRLHAPLEPGWP